MRLRAGISARDWRGALTDKLGAPYFLKDSLKRALVLLSILVLAGIAGFQWWKTGGMEEYQAATVFGDQSRPLPAFALTRHDGKTLEPKDFRDHWSLLFFGYSNCPDICSPSMQQLTTALQTLGEEHARIVFVSVDSERDSPEALSRYVSHFHPGTLGATGEPESIANFAKQLGAFYSKRKLATGYLVDHSGSAWLVDPEARLAGVFTPPLVPKAIAADLRKLTDLDQ